MMKTRPAIVLALACGTYLAFGMFNAGIGPVLGELAAQTGSSLAAVGGVLTFLFLGSLVAQIAAGPLIDKFGQWVVFIISLIILAVGLAGFTNSSSLPLMFALVFITGIGQGGVDLGANLVVSEAYPRNTTPMLNLLHFFFGLGAFFGPALVGLALVRIGSGLIVHWIAAVIFILLLGAAVFIWNQNRDSHAPRPDKNEPGAASGKIYLSPLLWLISGLILVYVGVEYGLGSWVTNYMNITTRMAVQDGALVTSAYWGALTLGRLAGAATSRRVERVTLLGIALTLSLVGVIGLGLSHLMVTPTIVFLVWIGFSFGTVYPTTVAVTVAGFPKDQGKAVGILAAMGSIGGLALPWIAGVLLENASSLAFIIFISVSIAILLMFLLAVRSLIKRKHSEAHII